MFCVKCGTKNEDTSIFCKNCGAKLEKSATNSADSSGTGRQSISSNLRASQNHSPINTIWIAGVAIIVIFVVGLLVLFGKGKDNKLSSEKKETGKLWDLDFTVLGKDEQPDSLKDIITEKNANPFQLSYTLGEELYIAVGYGEQPGLGYSISVNAFYETEDTLVIDTTLIGPSKAENVVNTPTRPYIVIKTKNIMDKMIEFK